MKKIEKLEKIILKEVNNYIVNFKELQKDSCSGDKIGDLYYYYTNKGIFGGRFYLYDFYDDFDFINETDIYLKNKYIVLYAIYLYLDYLKGLKQLVKNKNIYMYLSFGFMENDNIAKQLRPELNYYIGSKSKYLDINCISIVSKVNKYQLYIEDIINNLGMYNFFIFKTIKNISGEYEVLIDLNENVGNKISLNDIQIRCLDTI